MYQIFSHSFILASAVVNKSFKPKYKRLRRSRYSDIITQLSSYNEAV